MAALPPPPSTLQSHPSPPDETLSPSSVVAETVSSPQPPPPGTEATVSATDEILPPKADFSAPPPYEEIQRQDFRLPTYAQVQMEKVFENCDIPMPFNLHSLNQMDPSTTTTAHQSNTLYCVDGNGQLSGTIPPIDGQTPSSLASASSSQGPSGLTFIAIDANDNQHHHISAADKCILGTDVMFITAFIAAFLFNWIGFLMLTCFCHTIACRYGALSGFGLSLAKWTLIVKHSTDLTSHENAWLWWLIMAFGFLISIRALAQYLSIKRTWGLLTPRAQERLLLFY